MENPRTTEAQIAYSFRVQAEKAQALAARLEGHKLADRLRRLAAELSEASEKLEGAG
jgi:hypothetical protein